MTDDEILALNLRRFLERAPARSLGLMLDMFADELRLRNLSGGRELRQVSAQLALLAAARDTARALRAEHCAAPIYSASCAPPRS